MLKYLNTECPVCKRMFEEGDDIVTCPDCGTPHHRECYNLIGRCVNSGLHGAGYEFGEGISKKSEENNDKKIGEYYSPDNATAPKNDADSTESQPKSTIFGAFSADMPEDVIKKTYSASNDVIDGIPAMDLAFFVKSNVARFLPKFKKMSDGGKKISWNWSAFFFGGLYYMFRKMYAQGMALIGLFVAVVIGSDAMIYKFAPEYAQSILDLAQSYSQGGQIDPSALMNVADYNNAAKIVSIAIAVIFVLRVLEAMLFDNAYKAFAIKTINEIDARIQDNSMMFQSTMMNDENLSQENMRKMYLARRGGTSVFSAMTGALIAYMIISFI